MKIAIPTTDGLLSPHFGRCEEFVLTDVDPESKQVLSIEKAVPPPHGPGVIPQWLGTLNVDVIIAGGMGARAIQLFEPAGIKVVLGATVSSAEDLVRDYLAGQLTHGPDPCDHGAGGGCHDGE
ncbi:MAG: NifB/NifX family molybdenum-iron cluster-binding protein [bacterium]